MTTLSEAMKGNTNAAKNHIKIPSIPYAPTPLILPTADRSKTLENIKSYIKNTYESARKTAKESWGNVSTKSMETWDRNDKTVKETLKGAGVGALQGAGLGFVAQGIAKVIDRQTPWKMDNYTGKELKVLRAKDKADAAYDAIEERFIQTAPKNINTPEKFEMALRNNKAYISAIEKSASYDSKVAAANKRVAGSLTYTFTKYIPKVSTAIAIGAGVGGAIGGYEGYQKGKKIDLIEEQQKHNTKYLKLMSRRDE